MEKSFNAAEAEARINAEWQSIDAFAAGATDLFLYEDKPAVDALEELLTRDSRAETD